MVFLQHSRGAPEEISGLGAAETDGGKLPFVQLIGSAVAEGSG